MVTTSGEALVACFYNTLEMKVPCVKLDLATKEYMVKSKTSVEVFLKYMLGTLNSETKIYVEKL